MQLTDYHAKYLAYELTRRFPPDSAEKLAGAVASAQVDLNPHQVDAALSTPLSPRVRFSRTKSASAKPSKRVSYFRRNGRSGSGAFS